MTASSTAEDWTIVTGGSVRGGLAISRELHRRGLSVVVHHGSDASKARAQSFVDELNAVRDGSAMRWQAALETHPAFPHTHLPIATVVCNASHLQTSHGPELDVALADFKVHVTGHAALLNSVEAQLKQSHGSVVAVSDIQTTQPNKDHVWYFVAKAGLEALMHALAVQWAPEVRCNVIAPGSMDWYAGWSDEKRKQHILDSIPQQRTGSFKELASAVAWLALDATYVNGQVIKMDGGRSSWLR